MALRVIFALTLAIFALLLPAERLGLPRDDLKVATFAILVGAGLLIAFSGAETHFKQVFQKPYGTLSAVSLVLGIGLFLSSRMEPLTTHSGASVVLSPHFITPMLAFALSTLVFVLLPQPRLKSAQECFTLSSLLLSAGLLVALLPSWLTAFVAATAYDAHTSLLILGIAGLAIALGGSAGVKRLSAFFAGILLVFMLFPLLIELSFPLIFTKLLQGGEFILNDSNLKMLFEPYVSLREGGAPSLIQSLIEPAHEGQILQDSLLGIALGWFFAQNLLLFEKKSASLKIAFSAFFLSAAIISVVAYTSSLFLEMIRSHIIAAPAIRWPDFVFDDFLKGWLIVCGISPTNVDDVIRACNELQSESASFRYDARLAAAAIAQWRGWPTFFGVVTTLLTPMLMLCPLILLLHSWGSSFSESIAYTTRMPIALKSSLVSWMRIGIVIVCLCLFFASHFGLTLPKLHLAVLCSIALFIIIVGYGLGFFAYGLDLMRYFNRRILSSAAPKP